MAGYEVFHSFYSEEDALAMQKLLSEKGITCKVEKSKQLADKIFIGDAAEPSLHLKMRVPDFTRAHEILDKEIRENISSLESDYYLYDFSNDELMEVIKKPDEWSAQDFVIAQKILADRGNNLSQKEVDTLKSERYRELKAPEKEGVWWIILGYFLAIFFGPAGLFFGIFLTTARKMLPDGNKVMLYEDKIRLHGKVIAAISAAIIILAIFGEIALFWAFFWL